MLSHSYAASCISTKSTPSGGFICLLTKGSTVVQKTCMLNNSNADKQQTAHSVYCSSSDLSFLDSTITECYGTGNFSGTLIIIATSTIKSINQTSNTAMNRVAGRIYYTSSLRYCNFVSNFANSSRILDYSKSDSLLHRSSFVNNSCHVLGIIFAEASSSLNVIECSFVSNNAPCIFYANNFNGGSNITAVGCSLIDNNSSTALAITSCTVDIDDIGSSSFYLILHEIFECSNFRTYFYIVETPFDNNCYTMGILRFGIYVFIAMLLD